MKISEELWPRVYEILGTAADEVGDFRSNNIGQGTPEYEASEIAQKLITDLREKMDKRRKRKKKR